MDIEYAMRQGVREAKKWYEADIEPPHPPVKPPPFSAESICEPNYIYESDLPSVVDEIGGLPSDDEPYYALAGFLCEAKSLSDYQTTLRPVPATLWYAFENCGGSIRYCAAVALLVIFDYAQETAECMNAVLKASVANPDDCFRLKFPGEAAANLLLQASGSKDEEVSRQAFEVLCKSKAEVPKFTALCLRILANNEKPQDNRYEAARYLARHQRFSRMPVDLLVKLLNFPGWHAQTAAADTLVSSGRSAVPVLLGLLSDKLAGNRKSAAEILGRIGPAAQAALPRLQNACSDRSKHVRAAANEAIAKILPPLPSRTSRKS